MSAPANVEAYIDQFSGESKDRLNRIRQIVTETAPQAEEGIMYGLAGYKLQGKPLVYFGAFERHTGFYATPAGHATFEEELSQYTQGKGSVQFPLDQPLPTDLIKRMVEYRRDAVTGQG